MYDSSRRLITNLYAPTNNNSLNRAEMCHGIIVWYGLSLFPCCSPFLVASHKQCGHSLYTMAAIVAHLGRQPIHYPFLFLMLPNRLSSPGLHYLLLLLLVVYVVPGKSTKGKRQMENGKFRITKRKLIMSNETHFIEYEKCKIWEAKKEKFMIFPSHTYSFPLCLSFEKKVYFFLFLLFIYIQLTFSLVFLLSFYSRCFRRVLLNFFGDHFGEEKHDKKLA
jgi:hypothetical protein